MSITADRMAIRWTIFLVILSMLLTLGYATTKCPRQKTSPGREIICYTNSTEVELLTDSVCRCTTLVHQGYDLRNLSTLDVSGFRKSLKEISPTLQFVVALNDPAGTLKNSSGMTRQETTARLAKVLKEVDGIELNVTAGSKERLFHFVKGLKDEIVRKPNNANKRILIALPTKPENLAKQYDLKELTKYVDLFTIATDYLVDKDEVYRTFHPSRLMGLFDMLNTDSLVDLINGLGVPKRKLLVSVPASAYKFTLKKDDENAPRSPTENEEPIVMDRRELCKSMSNGEWTIERDEDLTAPYAFKNETWIAFEDGISLGIKGKYVILRDLAGIGIRDIKDDFKTDCEKPLTEELYRSFTTFKRKSRQAVLNSLEDDLHQAQFDYPNQVKSSGYRVVRVVDTEGHIRAVRENTQTEFSCTRQGYFVHPRSCNRFYRCVKFDQGVDNYSVFEFDCPAGLSFDERTSVCVWPGSLPEGSPCPGSSEIAPVPRVRFQCSQQGYFADPQNCRWFFACMDLGGPELVPFEFRCPYDLVFDQRKLVCEWPWLVPDCPVPGSGYTKTQYEVHEDRSSGETSAGFSTGTSFQGHTAGAGYTGSNIGIHTTGNRYTGTNAGIHSSGAGYTGSTTGSIGGYSGTDYTGSITGIHGAGSGSIGEYSSTGYIVSNTGIHGTGTRYTGSSTGSIDGYSGTDYTGSTTGIHGTGSGSIGGYSNTKYSGSSTGIHGAGTGYTGPRTGSIGGYSGTSYTGSTIGIHNVGTGGTGYIESNAGSIDGSSGGGLTGSISGIHGDETGSLGGYSNTGYSGSSTGTHNTGADYSGYTTGSINRYTGTGYKGSSSGIHGVDDVYTGSSAGSIGGYSSASYTGSNAGIHDANSEYAGSSIGSIDGYSGTGYTAGHSGTGYKGLSTGIYDGGAKYTKSSTKTFGGYSDTGLNTGIHDVSTGYIGPQTESLGGYSNEGFTGSNIETHGAGIKSSTGSFGGYSDARYTEASRIHDGYSKTGFAGSSTFRYTDYPKYSSGVPQYSISGTTAPSSVLIHSTNDGLATGSAIIRDGGLTTNYGSSSVNYIPTLGEDSSIVSGSTLEQSTKFRDQSGLTNIQNGDYSNKGTSSSIFYTGQSNVKTSNANDHGFSTGKDVFATTGITTDQGRGGYTGYVSGSTGYNNLNTTLLSQGVPFSKTTHYGITGSSDIYKPGGVTTGTIVTGKNVEGSIITDGSSSGTLLTHGDTSGTVFTSAADQGAIITGVSQPGYITTGTGKPGYVVSEGVKTVYTGSASPGVSIHGSTAPGTVIYGTPTPSVIIQGHSRPGVLLTGQTSGSVSLGGTVQQGTIIGDTSGSPYYTSTGTTSYGGSRGSITASLGSSIQSQDKGYKTTEYYGRDSGSTIGYPEPDLQDYRTSIGTLPGNIPSGGNVGDTTGSLYGTSLPGGQTQRTDTSRTNLSGYQSTKTGSSSQGGFTKTGPTRTGYTVASLGGSGSYVISTEQQRPTPNPEHIGEKAFEGNVAGYTKSSKGSSGSTAGYSLSISSVTPSIIASTNAPDTSYIDTSKLTLGPAGSSGYSYSKPTSHLNTDGLRFSTSLPISSTVDNVPLRLTTPSSHLNVEIYNTPKQPTSTAVPIGYTTGPLENYKTTLFDAAKIPVAISTVQPVIDSGYKTIVSPTTIPVTYTNGRFSYKDSAFQTESTSAKSQTGLDVGLTFKDKYDQQERISNTPYSPSISISGGYSPVKSSRPFGSTIPVSVVNDNQYVTLQPQTQYLPSSTVSSITDTGSDYLYTKSKSTIDQSVILSTEDQQRTKIVQPQIQYLPSTTVSPAIGVTYRRPFSVNGIKYEQSTSTYDESNLSSKGYTIGSKATLGSGGTTDKVNKLVSNYDRGSTKYVPSVYDTYSTADVHSSSKGGSSYVTSTLGRQSSDRSYVGSTRTESTPIITTYSGGYTKISTVTPSYDSSTRPTTIASKGKVIVKWSDLHPLLLGKLGAECTCKADPFGNLRGPGKKLIDSSKGKVDLSNYDESEIYVDLENEKSGEYEGDYVTNYGPSSSSPLKIINYETPGTATIDSRGKPISTYLPSELSTAGTISRSPGFGEPIEANLEGSLSIGNSRNYISRVRSGKSLRDGGGFSINLINNQQATSEEDVSEEDVSDNDEVFEGGSNCARPGLFRHPNFCNKFYACHWDEWKKKFTLHLFNCPVHLTFDNKAAACNWPSKGPACQANNLLV